MTYVPKKCLNLLLVCSDSTTAVSAQARWLQYIKMVVALETSSAGSCHSQVWVHLVCCCKKMLCRTHNCIQIQPHLQSPILDHALDTEGRFTAMTCSLSPLSPVLAQTPMPLQGKATAVLVNNRLSSTHKPTKLIIMPCRS